MCVYIYIYYYLRIETGIPNSHGLSSGVHLQSLEISPEFYCHRPDSSGTSQSWMPRSAIFLATPSFLGDIRYPPIFRLVPISSSESHPKKPASWFQRIFLLSLGWFLPTWIIQFFGMIPEINMFSHSPNRSIFFWDRQRAASRPPRKKHPEDARQWLWSEGVRLCRGSLGIERVDFLEDFDDSMPIFKGKSFSDGSHIPFDHLKSRNMATETAMFRDKLPTKKTSIFHCYIPCCSVAGKLANRWRSERFVVPLPQWVRVYFCIRKFHPFFQNYTWVKQWLMETVVTCSFCMDT